MGNGVVAQREPGGAAQTAQQQRLDLGEKMTPQSDDRNQSVPDPRPAASRRRGRPADDDPVPAAAGLDPAPTRRFLGARVPLWAVLASVLVVVAILGLLLFVQARAAVDLGPAVGTAKRIELQMTLCNADVDRLEINPRAAELDLEKVLGQLGAETVQATVDREDCPTPEP